MNLKSRSRFNEISVLWSPGTSSTMSGIAAVRRGEGRENPVKVLEACTDLVVNPLSQERQLLPVFEHIEGCLH